MDPNFENASIGRAHVAIDGSILRCNQKLCDIWGLSREFILNRDRFNWPLITHPDDLIVDLYFLQRLHDKEIDHYELSKRYRYPDSRYFWARITVWRIEKDNGAVDYYDVTVAPLGFASALEQSINRLADLNERL